MSIIKTDVFIASNFQEFANLRDLLRRKISDQPKIHLSPIDLNDGRVSHHPPLAECLAHVRRSEFMILLLGNEYGTVAPEKTKSFTHLEYEEAISEESSTRVLVFCIGSRFKGRRIRHAEDRSPFGRWLEEIERRHTVGFFEEGMSDEEMAKRILDALLASFYELRFGQVTIDSGEQHADLFDAIEDGGVLDDSDIDALESRYFEQRGLSLQEDASQFSNVLDALLKPAAVAALEQREEAKRAIDLADYGAAIKHLQRALEHRPLDLISNFWLARLYISLGRKQQGLKARELSERAARIAVDAGAQFRAAASYMLAARASRMNGTQEEALQYARLAVEVAPRYAKARVELARNLVASGVESAAMTEIRVAAGLYFPALKEVFIDPTLTPIRAATNTLIEELRVQVVEEANCVLAGERGLGPLVQQGAASTLPANAGRRMAMEAARVSASRQHQWVAALVDDALRAQLRIDGGADSDGQQLEAAISEAADTLATDSAALVGEQEVIRNRRGTLAWFRAHWALIAALGPFGYALHEWLTGKTILAILSLLAGIYLASVGFKARRQYRAQIADLSARIDARERKLAQVASHEAALRTTLESLRAAASRARKNAKDGLRLFESTTLVRAASVIPFGSLFGAKKGGIVRVWASQRTTFPEKTGRELVFAKGFPEWLEQSEENKPSPVRLYLVEHADASRVVLSRMGAYSR